MKTVIKNKGVIEVEALTLLGASTKRGNDSKIGMFGSGNKYAIAYLLRNNYEIEVFAGKQKIDISTNKKVYRDNEFDVVVINGKETSITTQTGPQWSFWQSIREIYSNAIDEGGESIEFTDSDVILEEGTTTFVIHDNGTKTMEEFFENMEDYFLVDKPFAYKNNMGEIYIEDRPNKQTIYRKNICVLEKNDNKNCLFSYNFNSININEDRLISSYGEVRRAIYYLLFSCDIDEIVMRYLREVASSSLFRTFERDGFDSSIGLKMPLTPSSSWAKAMKNHYVAPIELSGWVDDKIKGLTYFVPTSVYEYLLEKFGEKHNAIKMHGNGYTKWMPQKMTEKENVMLNTVLEYFKECNYEITSEIVLVKTSNGTNWLVDDGKILVSDLVFRRGTNYLASCILYGEVELRSIKENRDVVDLIVEEFLNYMGEANSKFL